MIVVYAIDALEYSKVEEYYSNNLKQKSYGKTDITEFSEARTMVLWSSFITGENKEKEILAKGDKEMWNTRIPIEDTFFSEFENPLIIDLPGYNYDLVVHEKSRKLLKAFFEAHDQDEKIKIREEYNKGAFDHHRKVKQEFLRALNEDHDFVLGYFSAADVIGHLNFGNNTVMRLIYKDLDELAAQIRDKISKLLILSDHGMKSIGQFGDHSDYGFWSLNFETDLKEPKITDFYDLILNIKE